MSGWDSPGEYGSTGAGWASTRGRASLGDGWGGEAGWSSSRPADDFSPDQIAGLKLWLESTSGVTQVAGAVSQWADRSASADNANQSTGTNKPTYSASDANFNGQPSITFNGSTSFMSFSGLSPLAAPCTVIVCGNSTTQTGQGTVLEDANSTEVIDVLTPVQFGMYAGSAISSPIATAVPFVIGFVFNGANSAIYQNAPFAPVKMANIGSGATGGVAWNLGATTAPNNFFNGTLVAVLVYNSVLSPVQLRQIFAYLKNKYGVAATLLDFQGPKSIQGITGWWRSDLGITTVTGNVSQWLDQSGAGHTISQATGANRPVYNASDAAFGGQPSLSFAGSQWLTTAAPVSFSQPNTILMAASAQNPASANTFLESNSDGSAARNDIFKRVTVNDFAIFAGSILPFGTASDANPHAIAGVYNGASSSISVDSSAAPVTGASGAEAWNMVQIGAIGGTSGFTGSCAEVASWNRVLTTQEIALVFGYFGTRYGKAWS